MTAIKKINNYGLDKFSVFAIKMAILSVQLTVLCVAGLSSISQAQMVLKPVDGVQAVPGDVLLYSDPLLKRWQNECLPLLNDRRPDMVLMIAILRAHPKWLRIKDPEFETIAVCRRGGELAPLKPGQESNSQRARGLLEYEILYLKDQSKAPLSVYRRISTKEIEPIRKQCWQLIEGAKPGAQDMNETFDGGDYWYLFAARTGTSGEVLSSMQMAQGVNPPKGGQLQRIWSFLMRNDR